MKRSLRRPPGATDAGYTLIELLIVIAIIAILAAGILPLTSTLFGSLERQETRREAIEFVRDEMALIRGGARMLDLGIHPASPESRERYPIAKSSEIEVREGPESQLREVIIRIALGEDASQDHVEYVGLMVVHPGEALP